MILGIVLLGLASAGGETPIPEETRQLVLVITPEVPSVDGSLQRFERDGAGEGWRAVGDAIPIVLGPAGLGSGLGLHPSLEDVPGRSEMPAKREGDGRSPAGIFRLTTVFGFDDEPGVDMPYTKITSSLECVDDPTSKFYNRVVDRNEVVDPDWQSSEHMRSVPGYVWGVVAAHNPESLPEAGSCIFLHVWSGPGKPTAGCTAMDRAAMESIVSWLDRDESPVLVQLPAALFDELRTRWNLPPPPH